MIASWLAISCALMEIVGGIHVPMPSTTAWPAFAARLIGFGNEINDIYAQL